MDRELQLVQALAGLMSIVYESRGVAGYYLDGDIAEWHKFPEVRAAEVALANEYNKQLFDLKDPGDNNG